MFGMFQSKRFGAHFADNWLHFDTAGWMSSVLMFGEEKLRFIEFLSDHKTYKTNTGVEISIEIEDSGRVEINFDGSTVLMVWLKHERQLKKFQRKLKEGLERYHVEGHYVACRDSTYRFGPYPLEHVEKQCKFRNFLLPMKEYESLRG